MSDSCPTRPLPVVSQPSFCGCECSLKHPIHHWVRLKESLDTVEATCQEQASSTAVESTKSGLLSEKT